MARSSPSLALVVLAFGFAAAAAALVLPSPGEGGSTAPERRPDLVQRTPSDVRTRETSRGFAIGFDSAVENHGDGPLRVNGRRFSGQRDMTADQLIKRTDGSVARIRGIGTIRYTHSGGHDHWHHLFFDRYELRRASDHRLVRPDRKTGFCLGDRYDSDRSFASKPPRAVITGSCLLHEPGARSVAMGISVGYGDDYRAYLEGQSIDVTSLPAGRYELVHRVNGNRRLRETRYSNNAASVLVRLSWPNGSDDRPAVDVLKRCPGRGRCLL
jgi:hypothetical protein